MKTNCSRCNGDDPSCYVCQDRQIAEDIAQLEYAFEMHEKCCEHLQLDPDHASQGDTLLEAICKLEKDNAFFNEAAKAATHSLLIGNERLRETLNNQLLRSALREQDFDTIRSIIAKGGTASDVLKFLDTPMA